MCGIFGWISFDKNQKIGSKKLFCRLMKLSARRGKDASGVWLWTGEKEEHLVLPISGDKLLRSKEFKKNISKNLDDGRIVIGHARLATNGSAKEKVNNQPLRNEDIVMVHNGIAVNAENVAKKFGIKNEESDTLVLLKVLSKLKLKNRELEERIKILSGEVCGILNLALAEKTDYGYDVVLASNNGSLFLGWTKKGIFFASEKIFLEKITRLVGKKIMIQQVGAGEGWRFEAGKKKHQEFDLKKTAVGEKSSKEEKQLPKWLTDHKINFEKIKKIRRCVKCVLPETTPFISFNDKGVCNYCLEHEKIKTKGKAKLKKIAEKYRSKNGKPDCLIAFSGGRDSSYGLHYLVKELKMHPVAVTFDWGMLSDTGRRNQSRMLAALGVECITIAADIEKARKDIRKNLLAWLKKPEMGMIPLLMQGDKMTEYYVDKVRKELGVKPVFFCRGNELEREEFKAGYCGVKNADPGGVIHNYAWLDKFKLLFYYVRQFLVNKAYWNSSLVSSFLGYLVTYIVPHNYIYLWHYVPWDEKEIISVLKNDYGWEGDTESDVTWRIDDGSPGFYNYVYCQIQGFTENDSFRSRQIREEMVTREEALRLVYQENKPRYQALKWYMDAINVDADAVLNVIDQIPKRY